MKYANSVFPSLVQLNGEFILLMLQNCVKGMQQLRPSRNFFLFHNPLNLIIWAQPERKSSVRFYTVAWLETFTGQTISLTVAFSTGQSIPIECRIKPSVVGMYSKVDLLEQRPVARWCTDLDVSKRATFFSGLLALDSQSTAVFTRVSHHPCLLILLG